MKWYKTSFVYVMFLAVFFMAYIVYDTLKAGNNVRLCQEIAYKALYQESHIDTDYYGTPLIIERDFKDDINPQKVIVISAGPDLKFLTRDDVEIVVKNDSILPIKCKSTTRRT